MDIFPRLIAAAEWNELARGLSQRVAALNCFLADFYNGDGEALADGVLPRWLVVSSQGFERNAVGIKVRHSAHCNIAGIDVVRGADGRYRVLEDNLRNPSGISYVVENRAAMAKVCTWLFDDHAVQPTEQYGPMLRSTLESMAPDGRDSPHIVVLTPGIFNSAYFEHAFLARSMGVELVEGRDLVVDDHTELELLAEADVETAPRLMPSVAPERAALSEEDFRSTHLEYLVPSQHVGWDNGDVVEQRAASAVAGTSSVVEMVLAVIADVRAALLYRQDSTDIGVTLPELLMGGAGVCQDFAHLALGMLRSVGVPARYVSGYLFAADETEFDSPQADLVSVQTHAWIEVAVPGWGWWALDPTNGGEAGERHVVIGCGRDYGDVPPVRGVFSGPGVAAVDAEVVIFMQADGPAGQFVSKSSGPLTVPIAARAENQHQQGAQQQ